MSSTAETTTTGPGEADPQALRRRIGLHWWHEVLYIGAFYLVYTLVRNKFGSAGVVGLSTRTAFEHAETMINVEKTLGLFIEPRLQDWYLGLPSHGLIRGWNVYYGTAHFVVTVVALVVLFRRDPLRYPAWRNTLAIMTGAALIGFASYTLMPPRLLGDTTTYGACFNQEPGCNGYGFVDTLDVYGGLWSFDSGAMADISNQYAAMPSLHTGWSVWCAFVLYPMIRRRWLKALVVLYPLATIFGIMVTGNHYWIDAVGGFAVFAIGFVLGSKLAAVTLARRRRALGRTGEPPTGGASLIGAGKGSARVEPADGRPVVGGLGE